MSKSWRYLGSAAIAGLMSALAATVAVAQTSPAAPQREYHPEAAYGSLQATEDARVYGERSARDAIDRQLQLNDALRWRATWAPYVQRYAMPYIAAYAPPGVARRVAREYGPPLVPFGPPLPRGPVDFFGQPYVNPAPQPLGHEKIWTSPNGYVYRPRYADPLPEPSVAPVAPATPPVPSPPAVEIPSGPIPSPPPAVSMPAPPAVPEVIPPPPATPAPVEF